MLNWKYTKVLWNNFPVLGLNIKEKYKPKSKSLFIRHHMTYWIYAAFEHAYFSAIVVCEKHYA